MVAAALAAALSDSRTIQRITEASPKATTVARTMPTRKSPSSSRGEMSWPVVNAASATSNSTSATASLNSPSVCSTARMRRGKGIVRLTASTATGSGGATAAPRIRAAGSPIPG